MSDEDFAALTEAIIEWAEEQYAERLATEAATQEAA